uniref:DUF305 domain-containing protein n=1 Tax=Nonomuraea pusilla TaxID=46177 RepID=UPI0009EADAD1|nr:DUF305 domain-containing protein [Nonomuraea pusilla]
MSINRSTDRVTARATARATDRPSAQAGRAAVLRISSAIAAGAGALVLLTACGGSGTAAPAGESTPASAAATSPAAGTDAAQPSASFNDADVMFAQMMIPHHRQAVEMADLAATRAADPEVKKLAATIKAAQDPEIETMRGWLEAWGRPESAGGAGHMGHGMPGMMSDADMDLLKKAKGAAFDEKFVQMMIAHHEGAIEMARTERAQGADAGAKKLADAIESAQQAEVEQMRAILDRL